MIPLLGTTMIKTFLLTVIAVTPQVISSIIYQSVLVFLGAVGRNVFFLRKLHAKISAHGVDEVNCCSISMLCGFL